MLGGDTSAKQPKKPDVEAGEDQTAAESPLSVLGLSPEGVGESLRLFDEDITAAHAALAQKFRHFLGAVAGKSFASSKENKRLARWIQDTANRLEIRLGCPDCLNHGTLQYEFGAFRMNHRNTTHSLGSGLPALVLPEPPEHPE